ncbi:Zinc-finger domain-containing protein [Pleurotus pulmonarius]
MMAASETVLSPSDPASSLRAAALSTIKRRKNISTDASLPGGKATLPSRPAAPHDNSVQLDYGQEDASSSSRYKSPPRKPAQPRPNVLDIDPSQGREEGEISDSEDLPPAPPKEDTRQPPTAPASLPSRPGPLTLAAGRAGRMEVTPPPRIPNLSSSMQPSSIVPSLPLPQQSLSQLDEHHVRPGLAMNQAQYDTAKDIVLDLLGWGVAPEFLVDCGLSREIVFYVFSELRLRLPENLDTAGLIPYPPDPHLLDEPFHWPPVQTHKVPPSPTIKSELSPAIELKLDLLHSPPAISRKAANKASPAVFISAESPSSSSTPIQTSVVATPVIPTHNPDPTLPPTNLHDMERQRRQELLARKAAAQASRKSKQTTIAPSAPASSSSTILRTTATHRSTSSDGETKPSTPTPALSVDDFLNSIAPSSNGDSTDMAVDESSQRHASPDAMDVDIPPPTSGTERPNRSSNGTSELLPPPVSPAEPPPTSADTETDVALSSGSATSLTSFAAAQDAFVLDNGRSSVQEYQASPDLPSRPPTRTSIGPNLPNANDADLSQLTGPSIQRRGTKRPVAADFVDFDGSDGQNRRPQWNSQAPTPSTSAANDRALRRRLTGTNGNTSSAMGGFASVSGMRRCIIDLSDSDGEADGNDGPVRPDLRARYSPSIVGLRSGTVAHSGRATPTVSTPPVLPPSSLIEKEEEIRRMRELIAQREQKRMQKLAMTRSLSTVLDAPPSFDASTAANAALDGQTEPKSTLDHGNVEASLSLISQDGVPEIEDAPKTPDRADQPGSADTITDGTDVRKENPSSVSVDDVNSSISSTQATDEQIMDPLGSSDQVLPRQEESLSSSDKSEAVLFPSYESPFGRYPLLRSSISTHLPSDPSSSSSSPLSTFTTQPGPWTSSPPLVDLEPLRLATWLKNTDPSQQICRFEIPGGGVCRDSECEDVHLKSSSRGARAAEPRDDDTARYLCDQLPRSWVEDRRIGEDDIRAALLATSGMIEERVRHALGVLHQERGLR